MQEFFSGESFADLLVYPVEEIFGGFMFWDHTHNAS